MTNAREKSIQSQSTCICKFDVGQKEDCETEERWSVQSLELGTSFVNVGGREKGQVRLQFRRAPRTPFQVD